MEYTGHPGGGPELIGTNAGAVGVKEEAARGLRVLLGMNELNAGTIPTAGRGVSWILRMGLWLLGRTGDDVDSIHRGVVGTPMGVVGTPMGVVGTPIGAVAAALLLKRNGGVRKFGALPVIPLVRTTEPFIMGLGVTRAANLCSS